MDSKIIHRDSDRKAVDVLYRISALSSNESNPLLSLGKILDEVIGVFGASSASLCMLNADSDKLLIEVEKGLSKESKGFELPFYKIIEVSKKNGDPKRFSCEIFMRGSKESSAFGKSHKQAEKNAARVLIEKFITIGNI